MKQILILISLLSFTFSSAFAQTSSNSKVELKVLSWNIYMLPGIANLSKEIEKSNKRGRAEEIASLLSASDYDIIIFQEAFLPAARKRLVKGLSEIYPFQFGPTNPSGISLKTNSGVFVFSKLPLTALGTCQYKACNGADCFAKKGAVLLEASFQGKKFQILGTHLNAGGPQWIRESQYQQIRQLLDDFKKLDVPQIVCGDMNTHQENIEDYDRMLDFLDVNDIATTSKQLFTTAKDRSVIDYIFIRPNNTNLTSSSKEVLWFLSKAPVIEKLKGNLSDHLALSASFYWNSKE